MGWSYEEALDRAQRRYTDLAGLTVSDVVKELDFDKISQRNPRRVTGTHLYAGIANFTTLLGQADGESTEELLLRLHLFAREASRIIKVDFDGCKVHFQGPRAHALAYRPVNDESAMAAKAALTSVALRHMLAEFNDIFELTDSAAWKLVAGLDHGTAIATRNGTIGDRELLFLGSPANHAAKIIGSQGSIRVTETVKDLLPASFDDFLAASTIDDAWHIVVAADKVAELASSYGWSWSLDTTRARLREAAEKHPSGTVTVSGVNEAIDKHKLGISNSKRVSGASVFADVDGFTGYIDSLTDDEELIEAAKAFHVLRSGMRDAAVRDFDAVRIQYQGDRMQAFAYQPLDDEQQAALEAVKLAAALNSIADNVAPEVVDPAAAKRLAIGLAWGEVLVSQIGEHGHRDVVSIGTSTAAAAAIQQRLDGGVIGIDAALRELLTGTVREAFKWDEHAKAYVATDLSYDDIMDLIASDEPKRGLAAVTGTTGVAPIGAAAYVVEQGRQPAEPLKPWHHG